MPLSVHLASLSSLGLISDHFFVFCEEAWPCLAVGDAQNEQNRKQTVVEWGQVASQEVERIFFF